MKVKFAEIISCSSQHHNYPATNLLKSGSSIGGASIWQCAKPGIQKCEVILKLAEPIPITGIEIGNNRCCTVLIEGATSESPEKWTLVIRHEFIKPNDAEDGKFRDQVQIFTKKELSQEIMKISFDRVKVTCEQPANFKVLFGLSFLILTTNDKVDEENLDIFGKFKVKSSKDISIDSFKEKYLQQLRVKPSNFRADLAQQISNNRAASMSNKSEVAPRKRPLFTPTKPQESPQSNNLATVEESKNTTIKNDEQPTKCMKFSGTNSKKDEVKVGGTGDRSKCCLCLGNEENVLCKTCNLLLPEKEVVDTSTQKLATKKPVKLKRAPTAIFEGVVFSLSGYKNPERDNIRRKAIQMGARYVADTDRRDHGCTHLVCAFKNTPKYNQMKGKAKIVSHRWVEECFDKKVRIPWRQYALDSNNKEESDSEDEIPAKTFCIYDQDTDPDTDCP
ncbi:DNA repair protein XRCC1 [Athalia rosae]|uniref:DNA repair protein XRCC1 n=1 Tax=Athalia rosae TaxID=37344 RepID=UPI002033AAFC|nr:DNA repair protein XRCC1 [Athalia rosae]